MPGDSGTALPNKAICCEQGPHAPGAMGGCWGIGMGEKGNGGIGGTFGPGYRVMLAEPRHQGENGRPHGKGSIREELTAAPSARGELPSREYSYYRVPRGCQGRGIGHWHCPHAWAYCPLEQADPIGKPLIKLLALMRLLMSSTASRRGATLQPRWHRVWGGQHTAWPWLSSELWSPKETTFLSQS